MKEVLIILICTELNKGEVPLQFKPGNLCNFEEAT